MAVKIRLMQTGKRNSRSYRVVAVDESKKRDGQVLATLGSILSLKNPDPTKIDLEQIKSWLAKGAQMTPAVKKIVNL